MATVLLDIFFVKILHMGLWGIAVGSVIPLLVSSIIVFPLYSSNLMKIGVIRIFKESWMMPLLTAVPVVIILFYFRYGLYPKTWGLLISEMAFTGIASLVLNWFFSLGRSEKRFFARLVFYWQK